MRFKIKKYKRSKRIDRWLQTVIISLSIILCVDLLSGQTITTLTLGILRIGNNVQITSGQLIIPDGLAATPSILFTSTPTIGWSNYLNLGWQLNAGGGGQLLFDASNCAIVLNNDVNGRLIFGSSADTVIRRDAANTLAQKNGNNDQTQRWYSANSSYFQISSQNELLTINAAASTDTAMTIPANAVVRGVAVRTVTAIPAPATNYTVTGATSGTTFNTVAVGVGAGSTDVGTQNTPYKNGAAQAIRITPDAIPGAATGQVRVILFYEIPSSPTS